MAKIVLFDKKSKNPRKLSATAYINLAERIFSKKWSLTYFHGLRKTGRNSKPEYIQDIAGESEAIAVCDDESGAEQKISGKNCIIKTHRERRGVQHGNKKKSRTQIVLPEDNLESMDYLNKYLLLLVKQLVKNEVLKINDTIIDKGAKVKIIVKDETKESQKLLMGIMLMTKCR